MGSSEYILIAGMSGPFFPLPRDDFFFEGADTGLPRSTLFIPAILDPVDPPIPPPILTLIPVLVADLSLLDFPLLR